MRNPKVAGSNPALATILVNKMDEKQFQIDLVQVLGNILNVLNLMAVKLELMERILQSKL